MRGATGEGAGYAEGPAIGVIRQGEDMRVAARSRGGEVAAKRMAAARTLAKVAIQIGIAGWSALT